VRIVIEENALVRFIYVHEVFEQFTNDLHMGLLFRYLPVPVSGRQ